MNFKHTGVFPEQAANWDFIRGDRCRGAGRPVRVLNLFAYTGGATLAAAAAGGVRCAMWTRPRAWLPWAKENAAASGLARPAHPLDRGRLRASSSSGRSRRGRRYDAVIMDPPSYGRGPSGEIWKLEKDLYPFVELVAGVLSDNPLFFDHQFLHHRAGALCAGVPGSTPSFEPDSAAARQCGRAGACR